jgi:hypothetical protein
MILVRAPLQAVLLIIEFLALMAQAAVISRFILLGEGIQHPRYALLFFNDMLTHSQIVMSLISTPIADALTCVVVSHFMF